MSVSSNLYSIIGKGPAQVRTVAVLASIVRFLRYRGGGMTQVGEANRILKHSGSICGVENESSKRKVAEAREDSIGREDGCEVSSRKAGVRA